MAKEPRISDEYREKFIDTKKYPPSSHWMLQGLAAIIEDELEQWRPTMSELLEIIPRNKFGEKLIKAGHAYGVGKQLISGLPAPSILMFCSALNIIGERPNVELKKEIQVAKMKLQDKGLLEESSIREVLRAAHERAGFDMVSKMLHEEFQKGLIRIGTYKNNEIDDTVREIVNIGHKARHEALVNIMEWSTIPVSDFMMVNIAAIGTNQGFWQNFLQTRSDGSTFVGAPRLSALASKARQGCAQALLSRLESLVDYDLQ